VLDTILAIAAALIALLAAATSAGLWQGWFEKPM
jgi:hypothetical protein